MTARLPTNDSDNNNWGNLLNSFLQVSLNSDGTLSQGAVLTAGAGAFDAAGAAAAAQVAAEAASLPIGGGTLTGSLVIDDNLTVDGTVTVGGQELGSAAFAATSAFDAAGDAASALTAAEAYANTNMVNVTGDSMTGPLTLSASEAAGGLLTVTNTHSTPTAPSVLVETAASGDQAFGVQVTGASYPAFYATSDGYLHFGSGSAAADTVIERNAANSLQTASLYLLVSKTAGNILHVNNTASSPSAPSTTLTANAAGDSTLGVLISTDTDYRFMMDSNGTMHWGPGGTTATDSTLSRTGAGALSAGATLSANGFHSAIGASAGGILQITNTTSSPTSPTAQFTAEAAADLTLGIEVSGDSYFRFQVDSNGKLYWGTGAAAYDTTLYRSATNTLNASGAIVAGGYMKASSLQASEAASAGGILEITNTTSAPTSPSSWIQSAAAGDLAFGLDVSGDADYRFYIDSNGKHYWGSGAAAYDTDLYRLSSDNLKTDNNMTVSGSLTIASSSVIINSSDTVLNYASSTGGILQVKNTTSAPSAPSAQYIAAAAADKTLGIEVSGDADFRFTVDSNGKHSWGSGSAAVDTDLYRASTGVLQTDETFNAVTAVQVNGTALPALVATTGVGGFALQNATPTILSWTTPNDGNMHRYTVFGVLYVTSAQTGGVIQSESALPSGAATLFRTVVAGANADGEYPFNSACITTGPNQTVTLQQTSAQTAGAATLWAEIWGS
jgi:hypothetical protein